MGKKPKNISLRYSQKALTPSREYFLFSKESAKLEKERSFYHFVKRGELREG
jgi:hypothetical protein